MHLYYPAGQLLPCLLHGCSDCVRPVRFAPYDWTADGTFIAPILAAVNFLNFPNIKLQGDFCVTASPFSHANQRKKHSMHSEKTGSGMKAPAKSAGWPSAWLWPAQSLCWGPDPQERYDSGDSRLCHSRGYGLCLTVPFPTAFGQTGCQFSKELQ